MFRCPVLLQRPQVSSLLSRRADGISFGVATRFAFYDQDIRPRLEASFTGVFHNGLAGLALNLEGVAELADCPLQGRTLSDLSFQGHRPHVGDGLTRHVLDRLALPVAHLRNIVFVFGSF
ncbi:hypothetical protein TPAR_01033 [Tolypocladium paradoxum]|uniref:Uncharacterized protein n=1 Tax=Tolypocladium paradoxum TaxID=94208 RepID=A0A2S4L8K8_9HYPO|nr:hypothetical protein TPAR_01033 [Tolypocladium paradoxum]